MFSQGSVAAEGRKVGSIKRRVRSHLVVGEIKKGMLLWQPWREANFEVKMLTTPHSSEPLLAVEKWKKCRSLWREAHLAVKRARAPHVRSTFGS